jgi:hypothetical protein
VLLGFKLITIGLFFYFFETRDGLALAAIEYKQYQKGKNSKGKNNNNHRLKIVTLSIFIFTHILESIKLFMFQSVELID